MCTIRSGTQQINTRPTITCELYVWSSVGVGSGSVGSHSSDSVAVARTSTPTPSLPASAVSSLGPEHRSSQCGSSSVKRCGCTVLSPRVSWRENNQGMRSDAWYIYRQCLMVCYKHAEHLSVCAALLRCRLCGSRLEQSGLQLLIGLFSRSLLTLCVCSSPAHITGQDLDPHTALTVLAHVCTSICSCCVTVILILLWWFAPS